jgi:hypothetical protein
MGLLAEAPISAQNLGKVGWKPEQPIANPGRCKMAGFVKGMMHFGQQILGYSFQRLFPLGRTRPILLPDYLGVHVPSCFG